MVTGQREAAAGQIYPSSEAVGSQRIHLNMHKNTHMHTQEHTANKTDRTGPL